MTTRRVKVHTTATDPGVGFLRPGDEIEVAGEWRRVELLSRPNPPPFGDQLTTVATVRLPGPGRPRFEDVTWYGQAEVEVRRP